jgi:lipoprotein signal peptidase
MIHLEFYWPKWTPFGFGGKEVFPPVFNFADACISSSVGLVIVFYKRIVRKEDLSFSIFKKGAK